MGLCLALAARLSAHPAGSLVIGGEGPRERNEQSGGTSCFTTFGQ